LPLHLTSQVGVGLEHLSHQLHGGDSECAGCRIAAFVRAAESHSVRSGEQEARWPLERPTAYTVSAGAADRTSVALQRVTRPVTRARTAQMHCTACRPRRLPTHAASPMRGGRVSCDGAVPLPPADAGGSVRHADVSALRLFIRPHTGIEATCRVSASRLHGMYLAIRVVHVMRCKLLIE
jgi:hypothetical protein